MVRVWPDNDKNKGCSLKITGRKKKIMDAEVSSERLSNLQCSSSELEKASRSRPMLIITVLVSGHT